MKFTPCRVNFFYIEMPRKAHPYHKYKIYVAQMFTLIHEFAHILTGYSAGVGEIDIEHSSETVRQNGQLYLWREQPPTVREKSSFQMSVCNIM